MSFLQFEHVGVTAMGAALPKRIIKNLEYTDFFSKEEVYSHFVFHKSLRKIYSANLIIDYYKVDKIYNEELYNEFSKNMRGFNYRINQRDINCYSHFLTHNYEKILEIVEKADNKKSEINIL